MSVVCSEVKEDYFLATIGAVFDDGEEEEDVGNIQELESGWELFFLWLKKNV
jgi:hypothetical protein